MSHRCLPSYSDRMTPVTCVVLTVPHTLHLAARAAGQRIPLYGSDSATGVFFHSHLLPSLWLPTRLNALGRPL